MWAIGRGRRRGPTSWRSGTSKGPRRPWLRRGPAQAHGHPPNSLICSPTTAESNPPPSATVAADPVGRLAVHRAHLAVVVRTGTRPTAGMAVRAVIALVHVPEGALPETGDAVEVVTEVARGAGDRTASAEVVVPRVGWRTAQVLGRRSLDRQSLRGWCRSPGRGRRRCGGKSRGGLGRYVGAGAGMSLDGDCGLPGPRGAPC